MKKTALISLLLAFVMSTVLFAHKGEVHSYMGTITKVEAKNSYVMKTTAGKEISFVTAKSTTYKHPDNRAGKQSEITVGTRVVVRVSKDGKTASNVKIAPSAKAKK